MTTMYQPGNYGSEGAPLAVITAKCHPWLIDQLAVGFRVVYKPSITYGELMQMAPDITGIIVTTRLRIDAAWIEKAIQLKWIGRLGSGLELIDVDYAEARGIKVVSSPEGNCNAVGEHALGMLLGVLNRMAWSYAQVREHEWLRDENRGTELSGKTVGIVGYGHTGSAFAKYLEPFGITVLACDKYKSGFANRYIREASIEQLQRYADVISFHVPLTEETRYMANDAFFGACKQRPVILNTSRGKVVELAALKRAFEAGLVSGAGLDVLENEKPETFTKDESDMLDWLTHQPGILVTPHIAGYSHEAFLKMAEVTWQKLFGKS